MKLSLQYADLDSPGYTRRRRGRGFSYLYPGGRHISNKSTVSYCRSFVIPPAWKSVWINKQRDAHILCTGVDEKSRKQYLYHPDWHDYQNHIKFDTLVDFGARLRSIRDTVELDLRKTRFSRQRVITAAVRLIDQGLVRVGNAEYEKSSNTFGATTLLAKHIEQRADEIVLRFKGKSNKPVFSLSASPIISSYCQLLSIVRCEVMRIIWDLKISPLVQTTTGSSTVRNSERCAIVTPVTR